jgi:AcrR family transcriptional regulator
MNSEAPAPRKERQDGIRARKAILRQAVSLATVEGLEGLSIGDLARSVGVSKSGLYAHFNSKQELQLATIDEAERIFTLEVIEPTLAAGVGLSQLLAVCDLYFDHLRRRTFPGGCFFASAALEMGTRPGPVKERVAAFQKSFGALLFRLAQQAQEMGQIRAEDDIRLLVFELQGIILAANANFVLSDDSASLDMASRAVRRRLGVSA